jgi:predicted transcriptional regulator
MPIETKIQPPRADVRERRERLGLTRQQLATAAGCSISMLALLEGGLRPSASLVRERIEAALADREKAA